MIKNIPAFLGVLAAVASLSIADTAPDMKDMVQNNFVETAQKGVKLSL
jgi:ABC-type enterochelin transport system permease subunit